jgi:hypothetical protein
MTAVSAAVMTAVSAAVMTAVSAAVMQRMSTARFHVYLLLVCKVFNNPPVTRRSIARICFEVADGCHRSETGRVEDISRARHPCDSLELYFVNPVNAFARILS